MRRLRNPATLRALNQGFVTIKTVIRETGAHRQTIHYYLNKGLLRAPFRISRTSALYSPCTVELIQLIKDFQQRQRLSLDEIKSIFDRCTHDPASIRAELESRSLAPSGTFVSEKDTFISAAQILASLEPPATQEWLGEVLSRKLILPYLTEAEDRYSLLASEVIRAIWDGVQMGISLDEFAKLHALISGEARQEIDRVRALMSVLPLASDAYRQFANLFAIVERFGSLQRKAALHSGFMVDAEASLYLFVGPNRKYNFPSETFLARMGLNKEIDNLLRQLDKHPGDLSALRSLARAYHLRSDWVHLHTAAQEILRVAPEDAPALAYLGQSLTYLGRHDEAVQFLENISKTNANPLLKLRLGQALVSRARRTGEPGKLMDAIVRKARLFSEAVRESRHDPVLSRKVRLNLLLDNMSLSDPLCLKGPSVTELQELKGEFDSIKERGLSVLARISLAMARMSIAYALYVIRQRDHHPSAALLRGEIMAIDPDGLLAARSKSARKPVGRKKSARRHRAH